MPLSPRHIGVLCLMATSLGWGLNWPAMKMLLAESPALFSRGLAGTLAACGIALLAAARGDSLTVPRRLVPRLAVAAALNVFAWMGFSALCMRWLDAGEGVLLLYTMPIWATLLAWPLRNERPTLRSLAALALGIAGVAVLLAGQGLALSAGKLPGVLLALGGAFLFALGTVAWPVPLPLAPLVSVAWQVGLGCVPMLAIGLLFEAPQPSAISRAGWLAMAYMTLVPMGLSYLTWFAALRRLPAATASMAMLLTPLVGMGASAALLGEPFGPVQWAALGLTLGGVALALHRSA